VAGPLVAGEVGSSGHYDQLFLVSSPGRGLPSRSPLVAPRVRSGGTPEVEIILVCTPFRCGGRRQRIKSTCPAPCESGIVSARAWMSVYPMKAMPVAPPLLVMSKEVT
jgi:hypothetical protein